MHTGRPVPAAAADSDSAADPCRRRLPLDFLSLPTVLTSFMSRNLLSNRSKNFFKFTCSVEDAPSHYKLSNTIHLKTNLHLPVHDFTIVPYLSDQELGLTQTM